MSLLSSMIYYKINSQYNDNFKKNNFNDKLVGGGYGIRKKNPFTSSSHANNSSSSRNELSIKMFNKKRYTFYMRNARFHVLRLSSEDTKRICKKENIHTICDENNQNPLLIKNYL